VTGIFRRLLSGVLAGGAYCVFAGCSPPGAAPLGLPPLPVPADNPLTPAKAELGRKIFLDRRLSPDSLACADCHIPGQAYTVNGEPTCVGADGRKQRRNSPTLLNVAYFQRLYHDGRETSLESQVWGPLLAADEMNNPTAAHVVERIRGLPDYDGLFEAAFAGQAADIRTVSQALASFERTLLSGNSRFDRWRYGRNPEAVSAMERRGFELFTGKAGCAQCHTVGEKFALFTDQGFHNTGIGWARSTGGSQGAEGAPSSRERDEGRFEVTGDPAHRWAYRTPSLRNVAITPPYMHDGSLATLREVVEFYDQGGIDHPGKDSRLKPLGLTDWEKSALRAFLETLTGEDVDALAQASPAAGG
jgi:cytochrome c peroxidase